MSHLNPNSEQDIYSGTEAHVFAEGAKSDSFCDYVLAWL